MEVGDLVKLKSFLINGKNLHEDLVGIIVDKGTERRRMYGDGSLKLKQLLQKQKDNK